MLVSDLPAWFIRALAFVLGALWGSFFNVAIYRWPRDKSVVSPPSHCPSCETPIPFYRNVPILGFLLLRGKAACCGAKLSPRYLVVELAAGLLAVALADRFVLALGPSASLADGAISTAIWFAFVGGLLVATFVDLEWYEIPDEVSIGGAALGLATVTLRDPNGVEIADLAIGAGAGYLMVQLLLVWSWERLTGVRAMGEGDARFLLFVGAFLGWKGVLFAFVGGAIQGLPLALVLWLVRRRSRAPSPREIVIDDKWTPPPPLEMADGTKITLKKQALELEIRDADDRVLWEHTINADEERAIARRGLPYGPLIALGALEFLFFGDRLIDAYLAWASSVIG